MTESVQIPKQIATRKDHIAFQLAVFCFWFSIYIYVPEFGVYLNRIGLSLSGIGVILGSYGISQILLRLPLGLFANLLRGRQKLLLATGFLMALISGLLFVYFNSFIAILIARLLAGITASMWVTATILYSRYFTEERTSQAMSLIQFLTVFAQFISMMLCSVLIHQFGWTFPFWVGIVASFIGILLVFILKEINEADIESQHVRDHSALKILSQTIKNKALNRVTLLSFLSHCILFITIFGFSPIYAEQFGITGPALDWLIAAFFVPHTLSSLMLSFFPLNDRMNRGLLIVSTFGLIPILFLIPFAHTLLTLSVLHFGVGLLLGFCLPILLGLVVKVTPPGIKMAGMGYYQSLYAGGIFLGPLVAGYVADWLSVPFVFWLTASLAALAFIIVLFNPIHIKET